MVSSVGSGSLTVEVVMAVSVQSRASCSGILVNSDFTSKDTSLWSSGIVVVTYIGETGRNLNTRLTEHKRATRNGDLNNNIAEHHLQTDHRIDWDSAECVIYSTDYYQRLTLESWFTNLEQTPLNRCQQFLT